MAEPLRRPTLAVITCNYNHAHSLPRSIEAVLSQTRLPDEYIIVDDGSTDRSWEIIQAYASAHPWIRAVRNATNQGLLAASRRAWSLMTSDYFIGTAADDHLKPGYLEAAMALAEQHPEAGLVFSRQVMLWEDGTEEEVDRFPSWTEPTFASPQRYLDEYLRRAPALHSRTATHIFRRDCFFELGAVEEGLGYWGDTFTARAVALKYGALYVPLIGAAFAFNGEGYCCRQVRVLESALAPIPVIAAKMRSRPFSDVFPESHVVEWEKAAGEDARAFHRWLTRVYPMRRSMRRMRRRFGEPVLGRPLIRVLSALGRACSGLLRRLPH